MLAGRGKCMAEFTRSETEQFGTGTRLPPAMASAGSPPVKAALSATEISFRYGDNEPEVIAGFNISLAAGEGVAIAGPSAARKTTLLKSLAGLLRPSAGPV